MSLRARFVAFDMASRRWACRRSPMVARWHWRMARPLRGGCETLELVACVWRGAGHVESALEARLLFGAWFGDLRVRLGERHFASSGRRLKADSRHGVGISDDGSMPWAWSTTGRGDGFSSIRAPGVSAWWLPSVAATPAAALLRGDRRSQQVAREPRLAIASAEGDLRLGGRDDRDVMPLAPVVCSACHALADRECDG